MNDRKSFPIVDVSHNQYLRNPKFNRIDILISIGEKFSLEFQEK